MESCRLKITVSCNNTCDPLVEEPGTGLYQFPVPVMRKLIGEHGLGYHVDAKDHALLFDMGGTQGTFMHNIHAIERDLGRIEEIIFSHGHHDHVGGLHPFLNFIATGGVRKGGSRKLTASCHPAAFFNRVSVVDAPAIDMASQYSDEEIGSFLASGVVARHRGMDRQQLLEKGVHLITTGKPRAIRCGGDSGARLVTTGEIPRVYEKDFSPKNYLVREGGHAGGSWERDTFKDDQALVVEPDESDTSIVLLGCCHAGLENTMAQVSKVSTRTVRLIAGGFHLLNAPEKMLDQKIEFLEKIAAKSEEGLVVMPSHCSGERFYQRLLSNSSRNIKVLRMPLGTTFTP